MRRKSFGTRPSRLFSIGIIALTAGLLAGCSSTMTRFNFPVFGLSETKDQSQPTAAYASSSQNYAQSDYNSGSARPYSGNYQPVDRSAYVSSRPLEPVQQNYGNSGGYRGNGFGPGQVSSIKSDNLRQPSYTPSSNNQPSYRVAANVDRGEESYALDENREVTVRPGDTLYSLSRRYQVSVPDIKSTNRLSGNNIRVGQVLRIPGAGDASGNIYKVQSGDTIYSIAKNFGVSHTQLSEHNRISRPDRLRIGQIIKLPDGARSSSVVADKARYTGPTVKSVTTRHIPVDSTRNRRDNTRVASLQRDRIPTSSRNSNQALPRQKNTKVASVGKISKPVARSNTKFRWPVNGRIISKFGPKSSGSHNDGINLAVPMGTSVKAAENGVVAYAGNELKGYGNLILVRHSDNWVSAYAHNRDLLVKRGDKVKRGQIIAKAGKSGTVNQPQVHFELRKGSRPVDPLKYMESL